MKLLHTAAAVVLVVLAAGCAHKPMATAPAPAPAATAPSGPVAVVPPMTTYGCDPLIARRLGRSC